jgi:basic membrane lipoprotein Med (substrate-binding protein (PBP1-ABC) superfamily)
MIVRRRRTNIRLFYSLLFVIFINFTLAANSLHKHPRRQTSKDIGIWTDGQLEVIETIGLNVTKTIPNSFLTQLLEGCKRATDVYDRDAKCQLTLLSSVNQQLLQESIDRGNYRHIVLTSSFAPFIKSLSTRYNNLTFSIIDVVMEQIIPNVQFLFFSEAQLGYVTGVLAAQLSTTGVIGVVVGPPYIPLLRLRNSFLNGVASTCPSCQVHFRWLDNFDDSPQGVLLSQQLIDAGCDVIWGAGGIAGSSAIYYAASKNVKVIGVDADEYLSTFNKDPLGRNVLSSAQKRLDNALYRSLSDMYLGRFQGQNVLNDFSVQGIDLAPCHETCSLFQEEAIDVNGEPLLMTKQTYIDQVQASVADRLTDTGVDSSTGLPNWSFTQNNTFFNIATFGLKPPALEGSTMTRISGNKALLFGGTPADSLPPVASLWLYNHDNLEWTQLPPAPVASRDHVALYSPELDSLLIHGGRGNQSMVLGEHVYRYHISNSTWSTLFLSTPVYRERHAAALCDALYTFGGIDQGNGVSSALTRIDLQTGNVNVMYSNGPRATPWVHPPGLFGHTITTWSPTEFFMFGGNTLSKYNQQLFRYDTTRDQWTNLQPEGTAPETPYRMQSLAVDGDRILYLGGSGVINATNITGQTIMYHRDKNQWVRDESGVFPNQHVAAVIYPTQTPEDCQFNLSNAVLYTCNARNQPIVMTWGGSRPGLAPTNMVNLQFQGPAIDWNNYTCPIGSAVANVPGLGYTCVECARGTYNRDGKRCYSCPEGGLCPGGKEVLAQFSYWGQDGQIPVFFKCVDNTCCQSKSGCKMDEICKEGYIGTLCSTCKQDGYSSWGNDCVACESPNATYIVLIVLAAFFLTAILLLFPYREGVFISNLLFFYQVASLLLVSADTGVAYFVGVINLNPNAIFSVLNIKNSNTGSISKCIFPTNGFGQALFALSLPILLCLTFFLSCFLVLLWHWMLDKYVWVEKVDKYIPGFFKCHPDKLRPAGIQLLLFIFLPLLNACLKSFSCRTIPTPQGDVQLMRGYPSVQCWTGNHIALIVCASIILVVIMIVIPGYLLQRLYHVNQHRAELYDSANRTKTGEYPKDDYRRLLSPYKDRYWFWFFIDLAIRLWIVVISVSFASRDTFYSVAMFTAIWALFLIQQVRPYRHRWENWGFLFIVMGLSGLAMGRVYSSATLGRECLGGSLCENMTNVIEGFSIFFAAWPLVFFAYWLFRQIRYSWQWFQRRRAKNLASESTVSTNKAYHDVPVETPLEAPFESTVPPFESTDKQSHVVNVNHVD